MIWNDFIKQQNIIYLDQTQKWELAFTQNPTISIHTWALHHLDDVLYFQDAKEVNGIHVPFMVGIQTWSQMQYATTTRFCEWP